MSRATFIWFCIAATLFVGCVHLPHVDTSNPALRTGSVTGPDLITPAMSQKPATQAIQHAVNWQAGLITFGGIASVAFGAFLIYGGRLLAGIKFVIGGLLCPVFAIWWSYHWLAVSIVAVLGAGAFLLFTHFTDLSPFLTAIENRI